MKELIDFFLFENFSLVMLYWNFSERFETIKLSKPAETTWELLYSLITRTSTKLNKWNWITNKACTNKVKQTKWKTEKITEWENQIIQ